MNLATKSLKAKKLKNDSTKAYEILTFLLAKKQLLKNSDQQINIEPPKTAKKRRKAETSYTRRNHHMQESDL